MAAPTPTPHRTVAQPGPRSLGALIENRRVELGLTKAEAARRAGVSRGTWHEVENGTRSNMTPHTLNQFDTALEWEKGTLHRLSRPYDYQGPAVTDAGVPVYVAHSTNEPTPEIRKAELVVRAMARIQRMDEARLRRFVEEEDTFDVDGKPLLFSQSQIDGFRDSLARRMAEVIRAELDGAMLPPRQT